MPSPDVQAFENIWQNLPQNYVPQYDFAMLENGPQGTGTYAFPASPYRQAQFQSRGTHQPVYGQDDPVANPSGVPDTAVLLGGQYGNVPIDPKYHQDLDIWNKLIQAGNLNDDEFRGFVANVFGNSYTLPAAFVGAAMGANAGAAASGGSTASGLAVRGAEAGLSLTQHPTGGGLGGVAGSLAGAATGIPGASTVGGIAGGLAGGALAGALSSGSPGSSGSGGTPGVQPAGSPATPGGSMAPTLGQPGTQPDLSDEDMLAHLRRFGVDSFQPRQGLVGAGLTEAEQAANASSQRLLTGLRSQITQLRQGLQGQFAQASRALGPAGSKLIQGAQGAALGQAGAQLSSLLAQGGSQGQSQLLSVLQGLKPGLVTALQAPHTTIAQGPADFSGLTSLLTGAGALNRAIPGGLSKLFGGTSDDTEGSDLGTGGFSPNITTDQLSALAQGTDATTGKGLLDALSADDLYTLYGP